jgi:GT2 family glycosyltransferase
MALPQVTIVVVPREQFSKAQTSLESVFAQTSLPFSLVYVDGNSPWPLRRYLERRAAEKNFKLIRQERYLPANVARNLALPCIDTEFVVFIDNDVVMRPGWLEPLLDCARETGAWAVGPLYCVGDAYDPVIHTLGAEHGIDERDGKRYWRERHLFCGQSLGAVRHQLQRRPIDLIEFHCVLIRTEAIKRIGIFDADLLSYFDHNDFCLQVRKAGGAIYSEPRSVISYIPPPPFALSDVPYFLLRWSDRWIGASVARFAAKHGIDPKDAVFDAHYEYQQAQRARLLRHPRSMLRKLAGKRGLSAVEATIDRVLDLTVAARA